MQQPDPSIPQIPDDEILLRLLPGFDSGTRFELRGPLLFRTKGHLEALTHQRMAVAVPLPVLGKTRAVIVRDGEGAMLEAHWGILVPPLRVPVVVAHQAAEVHITSPELPGQHIILSSLGVGRMDVRIQSHMLSSRFTIIAR